MYPQGEIRGKSGVLSVAGVLPTLGPARKIPDILNLPAPFPQDNRLEAAEIECLRGSQSLFHALSLTVESGVGLQVRGANGSGKTSLLRILCGLALAESGSVLWNGADIRRSAAEYRAQISYLGHKPALKAELTPRENLDVLGALHGRRPDGNRIVGTLAAIGIQRRHERPIRTLSAGQQQRTALARVMLSGAPLWILDEPATALDDAGIDILDRALRDHLGRGGLVVFASHQPLLETAELRQVRLPGAHD